MKRVAPTTVFILILAGILVLIFLFTQSALTGIVILGILAAVVTLILLGTRWHRAWTGGELKDWISGVAGTQAKGQSKPSKEKWFKAQECAFVEIVNSARKVLTNANELVSRMTALGTKQKGRIDPAFVPYIDKTEGNIEKIPEMSASTLNSKSLPWFVDALEDWLNYYSKYFTDFVNKKKAGYLASIIAGDRVNAHLLQINTGARNIVIRLVAIIEGRANAAVNFLAQISPTSGSSSLPLPTLPASGGTPTAGSASAGEMKSSAP